MNNPTQIRPTVDVRNSSAISHMHMTVVDEVMSVHIVWKSNTDVTYVYRFDDAQTALKLLSDALATGSAGKFANVVKNASDGFQKYDNKTGRPLLQTLKNMIGVS